MLCFCGTVFHTYTACNISMGSPFGVAPCCLRLAFQDANYAEAIADCGLLYASMQVYAAIKGIPKRVSLLLVHSALVWALGVWWDLMDAALVYP